MQKLVMNYKVHIIAFIIYLVLAFIRFPIIAYNIKTTVPGANGDAYQNLWGMWWVVYAIFHLHTGIYYTNLLFWPIGSNLIYETMSPLGSIITAPLQSISLPLAYNALFFIGFPLSALGMFILADYVVSNKKAAFIAGLVYSFSAIHIIQAYSRIDWMVIGWMPLSLYFLLKIIKEERNYYNVVGFSLSFVLGIFITDIEQGFMMVMLYFFIIIAYLINSKTRKKVLTKTLLSQILLSMVIIFVIGSAEFIPVIKLFLTKSSTNGLNSNLISVANQLNNIPFNMANSLDILSFFLPSFYKGIIPIPIFLLYYWKIYSLASVEKTGFLTYTAMALALIGVIKSHKSSKLWIGLAVIFVLLSLGPYLTVAGNSYHLPLPYLIYHSIPLINIVREPDRFIDLFLIAFAILVSYGYIAIEKSISKTKRTNQWDKKYFISLVLISLLFLLETSGAPITNSSAIFPITTKPETPSFYYMLRNLSGNFSIMQLPALPSAEGLVNLYNGEASYYSITALKPLVGGYITRTNYTEYIYLYYMPLALEAKTLQDYGVPLYIPLVNENYTNQTILVLYNFKTAFIILNTAAYTRNESEYLYSYLYNTFGAPIYTNGSTISFQTTNAVERSLFKSFVSYPVLAYWNYTPSKYLGSIVQTWSPNRQGLLAVYAPYPSNVSPINSLNYTYTANATMSFGAISTIKSSKLEIAVQRGLNAPTLIDVINVTDVRATYKVRLSGFVSGELGNYVMFITNNTDSPFESGSHGNIFISDINISRSD